MKYYNLLVLFLFIGTTQIAQSSPLSIPKVFSSGEVLTASDLNNSNTTIKAAVDDNDSRIAANSILLNAISPVGTVITSLLSFDKFSLQTGDPVPSQFDGAVNKWAPLDGRPVTGSVYESLVSSSVPDARGRFLRGLNQFDVNEATFSAPAINLNTADPGGLRTVGSFQQDDFDSHTHNIRTNFHSTNQAMSGSSFQFTSRVSGGASNASFTRPDLGPNSAIDASGGAETRSRNIAVFYYIKIN